MNKLEYNPGSPFCNGLKREDLEPRVLVWCESCKLMDSARDPFAAVSYACSECGVPCQALSSAEHQELYQLWYNYFCIPAYSEEDEWPIYQSLGLVFLGYRPSCEAHDSVLALSGVDGLMAYIEEEKNAS